VVLLALTGATIRGVTDDVVALRWLSKGDCTGSDWAAGCDKYVAGVRRLVVPIAWWLVRSRRHNVRDRLSDLVALWQAGLVPEQNYLEREREILQEI